MSNATKPLLRPKDTKELKFILFQKAAMLLTKNPLPLREANFQREKDSSVAR
jgi:hypothetical protein